MILMLRKVENFNCIQTMSHSLRSPLLLSTKKYSTFPEPWGFMWGQKGFAERHRVWFPHLNIPPLSQAQAAKPHFPLPLSLTTGAGDVPSPSGTHWGTYRDIKKTPQQQTNNPKPLVSVVPPSQVTGKLGIRELQP